MISMRQHKRIQGPKSEVKGSLWKATYTFGMQIAKMIQNINVTRLRTYSNEFIVNN